MPSALRIAFYTGLGVTGEVVFTAIGAKLGWAATPDMDPDDARSSWRLQGHSFVWMLPIYGLGLRYGFEPLHDRLRRWPWPVRGAVYALAIFAVEFACGEMLLRLTRAHVWRWTGVGALRGHIKLTLAGLWFAFGIALEPLHDLLVKR